MAKARRMSPPATRPPKSHPPIAQVPKPVKGIAAKNPGNRKPEPPPNAPMSTGTY